MATIDIGKIKPVFKGTYNNSTAYVLDDIVYYNGSSYVAKTSTTGNLPTDTTKWNILASGSGGIWNSSLSLGSGSQQLRVNSGATALEFFTPTPVAQNVDIVAYVTHDSTGVNTINITTDWSTNNYYKMEMYHQYQMSNTTAGAKFRFRNASGDITSDSIQYLGFKHYDLENHNGQDFSGSRDLNGNRTEVSWNGWGTNVNRLNPNVRFEIYRPDENNRQFCQIHYYNNDASIYHANYMDAVWSNDTSAKKGWSMYGNGGANFINGFYVITGYKYQ